MPCYEVNRVSVEFKAENEELLKRAANSLEMAFSRCGARITIGGRVFIENGIASSRSQDLINQLKRAYSQEVVKAAAKSRGWSGAWSGSVTSNKLQASFKKF